MTVFIQRGDPPLSYRQATKRGARHFEAQLPQWQREQGIITQNPGYAAWAQQWLIDNHINEQNNLFNHSLAAYRAAVARLAQYPKAEGRQAVYEDQPTGEVDPDTGETIMAEVEVSPAVAPIPRDIEAETIDPDTGGVVTQKVRNPAVVEDEEERAAAQATIDGATKEVTFFGN